MTDVAGRSVLEVDADGSGFEATLGRMERRSESFEKTTVEAAGNAGAAMSKVGDGAARGAAAADRAQKQLESSIQRAIAVLKAGERGTASYFEALARIKGVEPEKLRPGLESLRQLREEQALVARATSEQAEKDRIAAQAKAELQRAEALAATNKEAYLNKLREEIKLLGMSEAARRSYQSAQANRVAGGGAEGAALQQMRDALAARKSSEDFIASLKRQSDAIGKTRADLLEIEAAQRGLSTQAAPFIARLRETERGLHGIGVSAGQTRAAMAQLPAQFTDIFTSLAGGQSPLLVLIQQGGQIRDSFGGAGNALRAIGSLIKPITVAFGGLAAVVGAVALAYAQGSKEQDEFAKSLILTGNVSGKTVGQLNEQAKAVAALVGTQGKAAEVLTKVVGAGNIAAGAFGKVTEAAVRMERVGAQSIEKTVEQFSELGKSPLEAAGKLNEKVNFLSASIYQQIKALQEQGRTSEAARVAQEAYADALIGRTQQIEARFGLFERAWKSLGDAAKSAWDKMLNIGRQETVEDAVARAEASVNAARTRLEGRGRRGGTTNELRGGGSAADVQAAQELLDTQREGLKLERQIAEAKAASAFQVQARVDTEHLVEKSLTSQKRLQNELAAARTKLEASGRPQEEIDAALRAITTGSAAFQQSMATAIARIGAAQALLSEQTKGQLRSLQSLREQGLIRERDYIERIAAIEIRALQADRERLQALREIAASKPNNAAEVVGIDGQIAAKDQEILSRRAQLLDDVAAAARRQTVAVRDAMLALREEGEAEINAQLAEQRAQRNAVTRAIQEYKQSIDDSIESMEFEIRTIGLGARERAIAIEQFRIELDLRRRIREINATPYDSQADRQADIDRVTEQANRLRAAASSKVWLDEYQRVNDQIGQSLADALMEGGRSARDYLKGIFRNLVLQPIIRAVVDPISGAIASFIAGGATGGGGAAGALAGASNLSTLYSLYQGATGYSGGVNALAGYLGAGTSAGASGLSLGYANAVGAAGGDSLGALIAANNSWSGVAAGNSLGAASAGNGVAAGSGSAGASAGAAAWTAYAAAFVAAYMGSRSAWEKGFNNENLTGAFRYSPESTFTDLLKATGFSDRAANIWGGGAVYTQLFGRASPRVTDSGISGSISGGDFTGQAFRDILEKGGIFRSDRRYTENAEIDASVDNFFDDAAKAILEKAKEYGEALGLPAEHLANISAEIRVSLGDDAEKNKEAFVKALASYGDALVEGFADQVKPFAIYGETTAQTIERLGGALAGVNEVLATLGADQITKSLKAGVAAVDLTGLFGGADQFNSVTGAFYQSFYTEQERADQLLGKLTETFADLGITLPDVTAGAEASKAAYRDLVLDAASGDKLLTESGQKTFATLLTLAGAFDAVAQAADEAAVKAAEQAKEVAAKRVDLDIELLRALGQEEAAVRLERERDLAVLRELSPALVEVQEAINAAVDAAAAAARIARLQTGVDSVVGDFLKGDALADYFAQRVLDALGEGGITGTIGDVLGSTKDDILELWDAVGIDGKEAILAAYGPWKQLMEVIHGTSNAIKAYREGALSDAIFEAGISSLSPEDRIKQLKNSEAFLFGQIATADDPVAVAQRLQGVIIRRLEEEKALRDQAHEAEKKSLDARIQAEERLQDLSRDIFQFTGTARFGDLSPLNARLQIGSARSLYERTLRDAQSGDVTAQGNLLTNARAYLEEARTAYASGPQFAGIFEKVTAELDAFGEKIVAQNPQLELLKAQRDALDLLNSNSKELLDALLSIDEALGGRASGGAGAPVTGATTTDDGSRFVGAPIGGTVDGGRIANVRGSPLADGSAPVWAEVANDMLSVQRQQLDTQGRMLAKLSEQVARQDEFIRVAIAGHTLVAEGVERSTTAINRINAGARRRSREPA
jgi:phage-related minor tail protein